MADEKGFGRALIPKLSRDGYTAGGTSMIVSGGFPVCKVAWTKICMRDGVLLQTTVTILNWTSPMNTA